MFGIQIIALRNMQPVSDFVKDHNSGFSSLKLNAVQNLFQYLRFVSHLGHSNTLRVEIQ